MSRRRARLVLPVLTVALGVGACAAPSEAVAPVPSMSRPTSGTAAATSTAAPAPVSTTPAQTATARPSETQPGPSASASARPPVRPPARFDPARAMGLVERLASGGPRDAVSPAYRRAANEVARRLRALGYEVDLQQFSVPAGVSWGVRVPSGRSTNVVADPPGFDARRPHVVVGAHLDTVPQAPGAEDNASGVAVVVELARMARAQAPGLPVRFVAFGAEESRRPGPGGYAFGSRAFVARLSAAERRAVQAMVSLDRVGVPAAKVPVCHAGRGARAAADAIRRAADIPTSACLNRASDHVSFERAGIAAARIGSVPYDEYHSRQDVASVVSETQLKRSAAVAWSWLRSL